MTDSHAQKLPVSIVVPVYNAENYLQMTVESIQHQTMTNWELILVDDGSTDRSGHICDSFADSDSRIRVIHTQNQGVSSARNTGIEAAIGEWLQFVDSDDQLVPDALAIILESTQGVDMIAFGYEVFPHTQCVKLVSEVIEYRSYLETLPVFESLYSAGFYNSPWNKVFRLCKINSRFNLTISLGEDLLFNLEYLKSCSGIRIIPNVLYRYRIEHNTALTKRFRTNALDIHKRLKNAVDQAFYMAEPVQKATSSTFIMHMIGSMQLLSYTDELDKSTKESHIKAWIGDPEFIQSAKKTYRRTNGLSRAVLWYALRRKEERVYSLFCIKKKLSGIFGR